jgi:hypothetical protein
MLLFKSKYIKDLHNFVNGKMCYILTLTRREIYNI